jgi:hypothetical protein
MTSNQNEKNMHAVSTMIVYAGIVTAFDTKTVGTKVVDRERFFEAILPLVAEHDFAAERVPGQALINTPSAIPFVSAGVGPRSDNPSDFTLQRHRGRVEAYLKREFASPVESCAIVVYTREAYLKDPQVSPSEISRTEGATHVLVAVLAGAGPRPALSPYRFTSNLAGGNNEALLWSVNEIRTKASEVFVYDNEWATVADS